MLLRATGIGKAFSGARVLNDVSFDLRAGEVHVLAGENGAGKSTLIKIFAGIHRSDSGAVWLAPGCRIAVIHQELSLVDSLSVEDNIWLGRETGFGPFLDRGRRRDRTRELARELDLESEVDLAAPVERYPMSVKNRIEIAKALSQDANILIMDEPTSALTAPECERFFALIARLKARGCGIIYISHKMNEIYRLADRITVLRDGRQVGTAPASELPEPRFVHWMIGRELTEQFPERAAPARAGVALSVSHFHVANPVATEGRPWLVEDASFEVRAGEIVGIAGLQGSGNTELLNGLFGAHGARASGAVALEGKRVAPRSPRDAVAAGLALLTNDRKHTGLVLGMSVRENMTLSSLARFSPGGWLERGRERRRADELARELRIRLRSIEQEAGSLSGGNQQKIVLAKWLESGPRVLLLDEPTRGVDVGAKHEIYELLNRLTARGMAIVLISTELPELLALSDRVLVMHRGRITARFDRGRATQASVLRAAMGEHAA